MKTKLFYFLILTVVLGGCELLKDAATVPIATDLKADIPVIVAAVKSADEAGSVNAVVFNKTQDLSLGSNADIEPYLEKIKSIEMNSLVVTITGLTAGQTINSVSLDVTGVGNVFTQTNITMTNNTFTPVISATTLDNVAAKLTSDRKITLTVSGNASGAMTFTVGLNFDIVVTAGVL